MAYEATSTRRRGASPDVRVRDAPAAVIAHLRGSVAFADAWRAFAWSRLGIFVVATFATLSGTGALSAANARRFDSPALTHPLGGLGDILLSPLARWDSVWYLTIAGDGYGAVGSPRTAFFPLYPLLSRAVGELGGGSRAAVLVGAYVVALAALLGALCLLHRLTELELGPRAARPTVLLLCLFPASLFLGAPYPESVFLLASVGAFYAARTGHWAWAGVAAGAAGATRSAGILLLLPLVVLYLFGPRADRPQDRAAAPGWPAALRPRYLVGADFAWLALAPAGLVAYAAWLAVAHGDPFAFSSAQELWSRHFAGPFVGIWDGTVAAWDGLRQLASGSRETIFFEPAGGDPFRVAAINLMLFGTLAFALAAALGVLRRLPVAYGAYVVAALALPLSFPVAPQPLMSLPRFLVVLFPVFMWLGAVCSERGSTERVAAAFALGLGLFTTQYASWYFTA
ncbi:MAG: mannosyltransferase family protein [Thermoleophilaceae bacterium]